MESTLCCIPPETNVASTKLAPQISKAKNAPSLLKRNGGDNVSGLKSNKENHRHQNQDQAETYADGSPNLVDRLMSTVNRITRITGGSEVLRFHSYKIFQ